MATYFHGNSEIQGDGLQTLILMNPGYNNNNVRYSETQPPPPPGGNNFVFLNSSGSSAANHSLAHSTFSHAPPHHTHQHVGVPVPATGHHQDHHQDISGLHGFIPRVQYNLYNSGDPTAAREYTRSTQGLSLSLSPQNPGYGSFKSELKLPTSGDGDDVRVSGGSPASGISNGAGAGNGMQSVLLSSKYLKVTQELLEEVVSVGKGVKNDSGKGNNGNSKNTEECLAAGTSSGEGLGAGDSGAKRGAELSTAERQEIQMKKAKLVNMLDEVEQRYRQYHHQMQIVISWFEQVAGPGSAKTYTALALQTISKQFRCLKDAITAQIKSASKSLGEEDCLGTGGRMEGSRLKFVDNQIRQQRALQQLGMIQHNAWRPQRGLPERSVSVLRAWLFEHFLHPYPKDSDKHMLAKQTGLTRSQVSNWFINARVRLWKPMVEEMYMEELKEQQEHNNNNLGGGGSPDKTTTTTNEDSSSKSTPPLDKTHVFSENPNNNFNFKHNNNNNNNNNPQTTPATSLSTAGTPSPTAGMNNSGFTLIGSSEMEGLTQSSPKKQRNSDLLLSPISFPSVNMGVNSGDRKNDQNRDGFTLMGAPTNFIGGFGSYPIGDIGRFSSDQFPATFSGNGVSLTLGLPHCENHHQGFLPNQSMHHLGRRVEISQANDFATSTTPTSSHSTTAFDGIAHQNRKRFAAQLLPDYVT